MTNHMTHRQVSHHDEHGRAISYLRISVTDRCNYRCLYCMPEAGIAWKPHDQIMRLEEIAEFVRIATDHGVRHIRLTGGEPLVRPGICDLIAMIRAIPQIDDISLTTNGALLTKMAPALKSAGLDRVNISLDTLDPLVFKAITRRGHLNDVLSGIDAALLHGFDPVKINCVVVRSLNQDVTAFAALSVDRPLHVRFIEYMPVGSSTGSCGAGWTAEDTIGNVELFDRINTESKERNLGTLHPLDALDHQRSPKGYGPATYFSYPNAQGTVGFINARSNHFCSTCNRMRLTADGMLRPCLFSDLEYPIRSLLRQGDTDGLHRLYEAALSHKPQEHHYREGTERFMSQIGG